ncbi:GntR family transcriptional regulator [Streptomyces sp. SID13666]|uniref:GntR family transcriptional regulator n=1 Tax=Streptomyces TaxID=1883 RepID=UPI001106A1D0|nr:MULTISPECIES: GntR family transcriptional regulator [Streptomyces]MCZ4096267.1 GntR family transcriptional regulator [Streptomyces sp. H39-C1]NEA57115.1 GntR family transcriptional regulator [Streptomyces sp. SID13666]NEA76467.1 GntR family transcriptional regulator [Streptomyces sp. SID13588]QNA72823.1 GntR family transcriptional regulator [Streptomyces sp. So13.3]
MPREERPEYLRIAAEVRAQIHDGTYAPDDRLPTLPELCEAHGVSETTIRNALAVLRNEGLIETRTRAGTIVRKRPPVHRMAADRYRTNTTAPQTAFTKDQGIGWSEYRLDKRYVKKRADAELAALFECEIGEPLLARHFVFYDNDAPTQMSISYVRWSDVAATPVADPINEPWPGGTRAQFKTLGIHVNRITESFTTAMPTEDEQATLRIGGSVPVIRFTRRHVADDGRVVEVAHPIVRRGDTTVVEFAIDLDD